MRMDWNGLILEACFATRLQRLLLRRVERSLLALLCAEHVWCEGAFTILERFGLALVVGLVGLVCAEEVVPPSERGRVATQEVHVVEL